MDTMTSTAARDPDTGSGSRDPIIRIDDLKVWFANRDGISRAVDGVSFDLQRGETLGLVGESGCGKSVTAMTILQLIPSPPSVIAGGSIRYNGADLLRFDEARMRAIRGNEISMIFQDPMTSLNPVLTVGEQIAEAAVLHQRLDRRAARELAVEMLRKVNIPEPQRRADEYPHQFSGGMRQRAMIAAALVCNPKVLIADEPTTALDVTIQAQIIELMLELKREFGTSIIMITHDLGRGRRDLRPGGRDVRGAQGRGSRRRRALLHAAAPLHAGSAAGDAAARNGARHAPCGPSASGRDCRHGAHAHRRTQGLQLRPALPARDRGVPRGGARARGPRRRARGRLLQLRGRVMPESPLLEVRDLKKYFPLSRKPFGERQEVRAVDGISFLLGHGETIGIVGESGCGKSTAAKTIMRLIEPTAGQVLLDGTDVTALSRAQFRPYRKRVQIVFQDPYASLNPRMSAGAIVGEPLRNFGVGAAERAARVEKLFDRVGLHRDSMRKYAHEFSGGQRQRLGIARALALEPKLIVCDEPVSALDVSIQAQIINLLIDLQKELGISYIFVAHDLAVVQHISDRVAVMYLGRLVETGDGDRLFAQPLHPYTRALLSAVPKTSASGPGKRIVLKGDVPSPVSPPSGCHFHPRCADAMDRCRHEAPELRDVGGGYRVACWLHAE